MGGDGRGGGQAVRLADTAILAVELRLNGQTAFSSGIAKSEASLAGLNRTTTTSGTRLGGLVGAAGKAERGIVSLGGAFSHAGGKLTGLITGPLGVIGGATALFTLAGAIGTGIGKAQELGQTVIRLSALTGLQTEKTSALSVAMEHFNISADTQTRLVGFLEKNVGLLAAKKDGLAKFQKEFGLSLTDQNGKILDANALILQTADYFNNQSIPATTKAAALAKLYSRSWQDLIPFLTAGKAGIAAAEAEAAKFGLTLSTADIAALKEAKTASRDWDTALAGLETRIGIALLPSLTSLAQEARRSSSRITGPGSSRVSRTGAKFAGDLAKAAKDIFGTLRTGWESIPPELRQFLLVGFAVNKAGKFLFDKSLFSGLTGALTSGIFLKGSIANPMIVKDISLGGLGGGATAAGRLLGASSRAAC